MIPNIYIVFLHHLYPIFIFLINERNINIPINIDIHIYIYKRLLNCFHHQTDSCSWYAFSAEMTGA